MSGRYIQLDFDLIEQPKAECILAPHIPMLRTCFHTAWESWEKFGAMLPELRYVLTARTRAGFVNDHICQEVKVRFARVADARVEEVRGLVLLTLYDSSTNEPALIMRFKKLNRELLSSNIPTKQQRDFSRQLSFPEIPSVTRLTAGYQLDMLQSAIKDLWVTCAVQSNVLWAIPILDDGEGGIEIEFVEPILDARQPRVKPINVQTWIVEEKQQ